MLTEAEGKILGRRLGDVEAEAQIDKKAVTVEDAKTATHCDSLSSANM